MRVTFHTNIYGPLDGQWLYYNFAARSFHTTKLSSRLYKLKLIFIKKNKKIAVEPPFGGLRGNACTHSLADLIN